MSPLLASLESATLVELREEWGRRYGAPPRLRSHDLLRRILVWRIQAESDGGLDAVTKRLLRTDAPGRGARLAPSTILVREWKGVRHEVEVAVGRAGPILQPPRRAARGLRGLHSLAEERGLERQSRRL